VKFENPNDFYAKFCPGIKENDEKMLEPIQDEVSAPHKGIDNVPKLKLNGGHNSHLG